MTIGNFDITIQKDNKLVQARSANYFIQCVTALTWIYRFVNFGARVDLDKFLEWWTQLANLYEMHLQELSNFWTRTQIKLCDELNAGNNFTEAFTQCQSLQHHLSTAILLKRVAPPPPNPNPSPTKRPRGPRQTTVVAERPETTIACWNCGKIGVRAADCECSKNRDPRPVGQGKQFKGKGKGGKSKGKGKGKGQIIPWKPNK